MKWLINYQTEIPKDEPELTPGEFKGLKLALNLLVLGSNDVHDIKLDVLRKFSKVNNHTLQIHSCISFYLVSAVAVECVELVVLGCDASVFSDSHSAIMGALQHRFRLGRGRGGSTSIEGKCP